MVQEIIGLAERKTCASGGNPADFFPGKMARSKMARSFFQQCRYFNGTFGLGDWTARMKRTTARRMNRRWYVTR
jgi:hypothetical protein